MLVLAVKESALLCARHDRIDKEVRRSAWQDIKMRTNTETHKKIQSYPATHVYNI